jgi:hypothetical protein
MWSKIKAAFAKSWTIATMGLAAAGTFLLNFAPTVLDVLSMPEAAQILQAYKPGWAATFTAIVGILARLRSLKLS